jgi:glycosyltransferase involved in cell wall biosynthesis
MECARTVVVVPCYNEAGRLDVRSFHRAIEADATLDLVFVDDGSEDGTRAMLEALASGARDRITVLALAANAGKAAAVRAGMQASLRPPYRYAGYFDADLATPLNEVVHMRALLDADPAFLAIFASRVKLLGFDIRRKSSRHYVGRAAATLISLVCGLPVYDTQCGAKLFRVGEAVGRVFDTPFRSRWLFDVEILVRCRKEGSGAYLDGPPPVREMPVHHWHDVPGSKVGVGDYARGLLELGRIYAHYRRLDRVRRGRAATVLSGHAGKKR